MITKFLPCWLLIPPSLTLYKHSVRRLKDLLWLCALLLLLVLVIHVSLEGSVSTHFVRFRREPLRVVGRAAATSQCPSVQGNSDFYGIGIRIGIYLQWISSLLANIFWPDAIDANLDTNTIFLLALFVATVVATATGTSSISTPEIVVLLQLCFGFLFSVLTIWGIRTGASAGDPVRFPLIGSTIRLALATLISVYGVWFWFYGLQQYEPEPDPCGTVLFIFSPVSVSGGLGLFYKIQSVVVLATYAILFVKEYLLIICFLCYTAIWTSVVALISLIFSPHFEEHSWEVLRPEFDRLAKKRKRNGDSWKKVFLRGIRTEIKTLWLVLVHWLQLSACIFWSQANGEKSAGDRRPQLRPWIAPFVNPWIFVVRASIQWLSLFFFRRCPRINFLPLISSSDLSFQATQEKIAKALDSRVNPASSRDRILFERMSDFADTIIHVFNVVAVIWTIVAVEFTLAWNNITDIYTIDSTGQLIPFIIGIVSFLRVAHGLSIQGSIKELSNYYMKMFDNTSPEDLEMVKTTDFRRLDLSSVDIFLLPNRKRVIFKKQRPPRRRSVQDFREMRMHYNFEADGTVSDRGSISRRTSFTGDSALESFRGESGVKVRLYKDFRRVGPSREESVDEDHFDETSFQHEGTVLDRHSEARSDLGQLPLTPRFVVDEMARAQDEMHWRIDTLYTINRHNPMWRNHRGASPTRSRSLERVDRGSSRGARHQRASSSNAQDRKQHTQSPSPDNIMASTPVRPTDLHPEQTHIQKILFKLKSRCRLCFACLGCNRIAGELKSAQLDEEARGADDYESANRSMTESESRSSDSLLTRSRHSWFGRLSRSDSLFALATTIFFTFFVAFLPFMLLLRICRKISKHFPAVEERAQEATLQLTEMLFAHYTPAWYREIDFESQIEHLKLTPEEARKLRMKKALQTWAKRQDKKLEHARAVRDPPFQFVNAAPMILTGAVKLLLLGLLYLIKGRLTRNKESETHGDDDNVDDPPHQTEGEIKHSEPPPPPPSPKTHGDVAGNTHPSKSPPSAEERNSNGSPDVIRKNNPQTDGNNVPPSPQIFIERPLPSIRSRNSIESHISSSPSSLTDPISAAVHRDLLTLLDSLFDYLHSTNFLSILRKRSLPLCTLHIATYVLLLCEDRKLHEAERWMTGIRDSVLHLKEVRVKKKGGMMSRSKQHEETMQVWKKIMGYENWKECFELTVERMEDGMRERVERGLGAGSEGGSLRRSLRRRRSSSSSNSSSEKRRRRKSNDDSSGKKEKWERDEEAEEERRQQQRQHASLRLRRFSWPP